jgi:hypothetical protein
MGQWVPSPERHREIVAAWREIREERDVAIDVVKLPLEVYRALPPDVRKRQWFATWNPWRTPSFGVAWETMLDELAGGQWRWASDVRRAMVEASGIGWKPASQGIWQAEQAGVVEKWRFEGTRRLCWCRIRLRDDAPAHLLERPVVSHAFP